MGNGRPGPDFSEKSESPPDAAGIAALAHGFARASRARAGSYVQARMFARERARK